MLRVRKTTAFSARLALMFGLPFAGLFIVNMINGRLNLEVAGWIGLVGGALFALGFLAGTCAFAQRRTRCLMRLRWLPVAYAAAVVLGPAAAADAYHVVRPKVAPHAAEQLPAKLDLVLVQPPRTQFGPAKRLPAAGEDPDEARRWNVQFSVVSAAHGSRRAFRLRLIGAGTRRAALKLLAASQGPLGARGIPLRSLVHWPGWRPDAIRAVVLNVDGIHTKVLNERSTNSRPVHWESMVGSPSRKLPIYVILGEATDSRLHAWQRWARRSGGEAVRFRDAGRRLLVDAALRLATEPSSEFVYDELAWRHRPILLFDSRESLPNPLDVEKFLASDKVEVCRKTRWFVTCVDANNPQALAPGPKYLSFDPREVRATELPGAIYYHALRHRSELYLDYWWYFPYNPTAVGKKALCGPGLTTPGVTCFDHESDWEGITVVFRKERRTWLPWKVVYAEHEFGVAYRWDQLAYRWEKRGLREGDRPIVFVATDSHASYPERCLGGCAQIDKPLVRKDGTHDGLVPWMSNSDAECGESCLKRLPQTRDGKPALWNSSPLPWGKQTCLFGTSICNRAAPPLAPRYQGRFAEPWRPLERGRSRRFYTFRVKYSKYE